MKWLPDFQLPAKDILLQASGHMAFLLYSDDLYCCTASDINRLLCYIYKKELLG